VVGKEIDASTIERQERGPVTVMARSSAYETYILSPDDSLEEWDRFVDDSPQGCIFCRSWWLQTVCPDGFQILTLRKGGEIVAGIPMYTHRRLGYKVICMPQLTQTLGVLLAPSADAKYERKLSREMEILNALIEAIPRFNYFRMEFHGNFTNWLPFYWVGYRQTTMYSYVIPDLTDLDKVFSEFAHSKRKNIKKAESLVSVFADLPAEEFYSNHVLTLSKQGDQIIYGFDLFKGIHDAAYENGCGKTWYALDGQNNIHAAIFVVFDSKSAYYLISSIDPDFRNSGAATLLVKHAIAYVSQYTSKFDFEGSMIRGVENSFRRFGAIQTPYFSISKGNRVLGTYFRMRIGGINMIAGIKLRKHKKR